MRYSRLLGAFGLVVITIASATSDAVAQTSRVRIKVYGQNAPLVVDSLASVYEVKADRSATFTAAEQALRQLGATIDHRDSVSAIVGMTNGQLRRRLGTIRLSRIVNCGSGLTGTYADIWRVYLSVYAFVDPVDSTTSRLHVAVVGGARDVAGTSTQPVQCVSTGIFEEMVHERTLQLLAPAP